MISIGGLNFVPSPSYNITPTFFYFGKDIIGGYFTIEIAGTHHAEDKEKYEEIIEDLTARIGSCATIHLTNLDSSCLNIGTLENIDGSVGRIIDANASPAGSSFDINYTITIELTKNNKKEKLIPHVSNIPFDSYFDKSTIIKSYSETISSDFSDMSEFYINNNGEFIKNYGKFNVQLDVGLYNSDLCDSSSTNHKAKINSFLEGMASYYVESKKINELAMDRSDFEIYPTNTKKTLRASGGSISFELYIFPKETAANKAIIDFSQTEEYDQITGYGTVKIKVSILGVNSNKEIFTSDNDSFENAKDTYNALKSYVYYPLTGDRSLLYACSEDDGSASEVPGTPGTPGTPGGGIARLRTFDETNCYKMTSSRIVEFPTAGKIDFEMTYEEKNKYDLLGFKITSQYEERPAVTGRVEHIVPNRPFNYPSLSYTSLSTSAPRYKITVQADIPNGCLMQSVGADKLPVFISSGVRVQDIKDAVSGEMLQVGGFYQINHGNYIMISEVTNESRYKYSITREFIQCQ